MSIDALMLLERMHEHFLSTEPIGWVVVNIDIEDGGHELAHAVGVYPDQFSAACAAAAFDLENERLQVKDWKHVLVPLMPAEK